MEPDRITNFRELLDAAEACRPGTDDGARLLRDVAASADGLLRPGEVLPPADAGEIWNEARLARRLDRLEAFDVAVRRVGEQVPVPEGLADRLLAALAAAASSSTSSEADAPAVPSVARVAELRASDPEAASPGRWSRRRWLTVGGSSLAATAAGVAFVLWLNERGRRDLTLDDVLQQALAYHGSRPFRGLTFRPTSEVRPPEEFSPSAYLSRSPVAARWALLDGRLLGRPGVAYDWASDREPPAVLFVVQAGKLGAPGIPSLPSAPAQTPVTTGGFSSAAWREGDRICILLIKGDERRYRTFLRHGGGVFA